MTNYQLFGIACFEKDYRLSYFINKNLDTELIKQDNPLEIKLRNNKFTTYFFHSRSPDYDCFLLPNETKGNVILPKYKKVQFLFLVKRNPICIEEKSFSQLLSSTPNILASFEIKDEAEIRKIKAFFEPKEE